MDLILVVKDAIFSKYCLPKLDAPKNTLYQFNCISITKETANCPAKNSKTLVVPKVPFTRGLSLVLST